MPQNVVLTNQPVINRDICRHEAETDGRHFETVAVDLFEQLTAQKREFFSGRTQSEAGRGTSPGIVEIFGIKEEMLLKPSQ